MPWLGQFSYAHIWLLLTAQATAFFYIPRRERNVAITLTWEINHGNSVHLEANKYTKI